MTVAAMDNDVLLKGACYRLIWDMIACVPAQPSEIGYLATARFVLASRLPKTHLVGHREEYYQLAVSAISRGKAMEPTEAEVRIAAELEYAAQHSALSLDSGETLLCAIVSERQFCKLITGDKRAVGSLEALAKDHPAPARLAGRVVCLEQLVTAVVASRGPAAVRAAVCGEAGVDITLAICFGCSSSQAEPGAWSAGLASYIASLRKVAPLLLSASPET
jgi:hypothetical protein